MRLTTVPGLRSTKTTTTITTAAALLNYSIPSIARRSYATQNAESKRRSVTPFNDDGRIPWTELSGREKTARAAQQTFNFGMVIVGLVLTGGVGYFLYQEVLSPDSKTAYFNRAVDRIRLDPRCIEVLGEGKKIVAFGEQTSNKWARARPIASTHSKDARGDEHIAMHFNVRGPKGSGVVQIHLLKRVGEPEFQYRYFYVDVKDGHRIYLENAEATKPKGGDRKERKFLGVKWS